MQNARLFLGAQLWKNKTMANEHALTDEPFLYLYFCKPIQTSFCHTYFSIR